MSKLLTKTELFRITGSNAPETQKAQLRANGIPFSVNRKGEPALTWDVYNQALLARAASTPAANSSTLPSGFKLPKAS